VPGSIFAFVRWASNDFGTIISRIDILRAVAPGQRCVTVPYVRPGREALLMGAPALPVIGDILGHTLSPLISRAIWPLMMAKIFGPRSDFARAAELIVQSALGEAGRMDSAACLRRAPEVLPSVRYWITGLRGDLCLLAAAF
jgi:Protein of unknown function (DUF2840)